MAINSALTFIFGLALSLTVVNSEQSFTCDFERDTCGFTNVEGNTATWTRKEIKLGGREGYVMTVELNDTTVQSAKMVTPYFEVHDEIPGCFTFDFYTSGNGIQYFNTQQERNFGIAAIWLFDKKSSGWQKARVSVTIDESTRFIFHAVIDPSVGESVVAVDNVVLKLSQC
ncbi:uncharacterized protein LOC118189733 [Stegodyphus dumicola]|uniref:uncharacterized protein LOC118189733 n=1 Tax=Stegodyphus dumicola TaxID=202533 RepID=UPI0015B2AECB|nr:uncharacterized protein LOC118189733 [Stegodyphus dumicola]